MDKKILKHIIHSGFKKLIKHGKQMRKDGDAEAIHIFRTGIKKIRAFLRLLSLQTADNIKLPPALKKMYTSAGSIRDAHLKSQRLQSMLYLGKQHAEISFHSWEGLAALQQDFLSTKELQTAESSLEKHFPEILFNATVQTFFQQQQSGIIAIMATSDYRDEQLHKIRKHLKDILYITSIYEDMQMEFPFAYWNKAELKFAEDLAHALGLFNDAAVMLTFICSPECKSIMTIEQWNDAHDKCLQEKEELKQAVLKQLPALKMMPLS